MKIIKAKKALSLPINGEKPRKGIMRVTVGRGVVTVAHPETLKSLPKGSYELFDGKSFKSTLPKKKEKAPVKKSTGDSTKDLDKNADEGADKVVDDQTTEKPGDEAGDKAEPTMTAADILAGVKPE